ncbi:MAG: hypothetical protein HUU01_08895 [Saprospiraceae bacterium]|nr:hypothetical protein [Saprospiraceae bacterium]
MKKNFLFSIVLGFALFMAQGLNAQNLSLGGTISTEQGLPVGMVSVVLMDDQGVVLDSVMSAGTYSFSNLAAGTYRLRLGKSVNPINGVSTFDAVLASRHLLGQAPINSPYAQLAADINRDGTISVWDFVFARMLILGIQSDFSDQQSWRFVRSDLSFQGVSNPFQLAYGTSNAITLTTGDVTSFNFIGYKIFDLNNSSVPGN